LMTEARECPLDSRALSRQQFARSLRVHRVPRYIIPGR
jgi:hypothetical protein